MEMQHINVKIFMEDGHKLNFSEFNPVFQTWIQKNLTPELLIDVADYLHVPEGPGMVLVGLEADYAMDHTDGRWGLRYNRKAAADGTNQDRLKAALRTALEACQRLEADERLKGKFKFRTDEIEIFINDRALAPNSDETFQAAKPDLEKTFAVLLGNKDFAMTRHSEPRSRFGVTVKSAKSQNLSALLKNIS
jgi:hypothetical protein